MAFCESLTMLAVGLPLSACGGNCILKRGHRKTDAPILRRLRRHLLPKEGGYSTSSCTTGDTKAWPVTLTSYSSPKAIPSPFEPFEPSEPSEPEPRSGSMGDTATLSGQRTLSNLRTFGPMGRQTSGPPAPSTFPFRAFGPMGQSKNAAERGVSI